MSKRQNVTLYLNAKDRRMNVGEFFFNINEKSQKLLKQMTLFLKFIPPV
jgi:hypothetical protein